MKTLFVMTLISATFIMHSATAASGNTGVTWKMDLKKSGAKWEGSFMKNSVHASMKFKSGDFVMKNGKISTGTVIADMKSLESDSGIDAQVKSVVFLDVETYPTAELKITEYTDVHPFAPGGPTGHIKGTVTLKGKPHDVDTSFVMKKTANGFHASGTFPTVYQKIVDGKLTYDIWAAK
jgi:polyisoprenoid-binding protein YceI